MTTVAPCLAEALGRISDFIAEATGQTPTQEEVADALTRYFVLQEIKAHIEIVRQQE